MVFYIWSMLNNNNSDYSIQETLNCCLAHNLKRLKGATLSCESFFMPKFFLRGYVENVFFLLNRAASLKTKEIFNKSTSIKILITRQGNKQATQKHKIRSVVCHLRDQFPFLKDRFSEYLSLES